MIEYHNEFKKTLEILDTMVDISEKMINSCASVDASEILVKIFDCLNKRVEIIAMLIEDRNKMDKIYLSGGIIFTDKEKA